MKKLTLKAVSFILCSAIFISMFIVGTSAANKADVSGSDAEKSYSQVEIYLGGKRVLQNDALLINSVTYVGIRSFADLVGNAKVSWDSKSRTASVSKGGKTAYAREGSYYISQNGRYFYTVEPIKIINDKIFVPVRPIAKALGVEVYWDGEKRAVSLKNTGKLPVSADKFYNSNDLYWLSRIISAESAGESLKGQIAVGNVVLNRKKSPAYPNTVYGVIFDRKHGTQFSPVSMGTIYREPTAQSVIAAKICLEGYSISEKILFFMNPKIATNNWISKNRPFEFRIGNHNFYS